MACGPAEAGRAVAWQSGANTNTTNYTTRRHMEGPVTPNLRQMRVPSGAAALCEVYVQCGHVECVLSAAEWSGESSD